MYILECSDGSYYTGSTNNLELRIQQHQNGEGANHTKKRLPVKLLYTEEFQRVDDAFYREKQEQGWSRKKKEALINGDFGKLVQLAKNYTQFPDVMVASTSSATEETTSSATNNPLPEPVEGNSKSVKL
ncbi:putative endonuclease [Bizionia echini]|uniref:Putative endonuclease n=2 Tax=Bizionia echini TaxID=649333 RepID=A0A1I5AFT5_9FLAO|nr:putative endonuclease [Bizionia echini]